MTAPTAPRPRGRRPGRTDTRATILHAAQSVFETRGYAKASLRGVARASSVDPALVHHYFGSKAGLFAAAVLGVEFSPAGVVEQAVSGASADAGHELATALWGAWHQPGVAERSRELLQNALEGHPVRPISEFVTRELFVPVADHYGHPDAPARAALAFGATLGSFLGQQVVGIPGRPSLAQLRLVTGLGRSLQQYLVEEW